MPELAGSANGPLAGLTCGIRDRYHIVGARTGFVHPVWRETHALRTVTASALTLLCVAGHAGWPQVNLPLARADNLPAGLSLIAARGHDALLLKLARELGQQCRA